MMLEVYLNWMILVMLLNMVIVSTWAVDLVFMMMVLIIGILPWGLMHWETTQLEKVTQLWAPLQWVKIRQEVTILQLGFFLCIITPPATVILL